MNFLAESLHGENSAGAETGRGESSSQDSSPRPCHVGDAFFFEALKKAEVGLAFGQSKGVCRIFNIEAGSWLKHKVIRWATKEEVEIYKEEDVDRLFQMGVLR